MHSHTRISGHEDVCRLANRVIFVAGGAKSRTLNDVVPRRCCSNKMSIERSRIKALAQSVCLLVCIASLLVATCVSCKQEADEQSIGSYKRSSDSNTDHEATSSGEPRQYFKINVETNQGKRRAFRGTRKSEQTIAGSRQDSPTTSAKQRISNATLKKLLNQSLALAANGTSPLSGGNYHKSDKGSNFKFVFIQKATASPKKQALSGQQKPFSTKEPLISGINSTATQSLAASVSKQLAKTLLNSATNLVGNLSSVPSLSSIASQMIGQPLDLTELNSITTNRKQDSSLDSPVKGKSTKPVNKNSSASTKSRPSKIYNLPVKFVANGQPNHLVFSTIKKHFATIKKLQDERQKSYSGGSGDSDKQRRRHKLKGNSRLIYLPIKYLSNAKPNRILATKAIKSTHKSTS